MKKLLSACLCFLVAFFTSLPLGQTAEVNRGKIIFVPHDDRPTSGPISAEAVQMLGYDVVMPPEELLGGLSKQGDPVELEKWTTDNIKGAIAAVISSDSVIYGGLVASRKHELSSDELQNRIDTIVNLKKKNRKLKIYMFGSLMRTPSSPETSGGEEPDYYMTYGREIFRRTGLLDKEENTGLSDDERAELSKLQEYIPEDVWLDWTNRRKKNIDVTKKLIDLTRKGKIDYFIVGKDDNAPLSATHMESRQLLEYAKNMSKDKFQLLAGIDEFAMLSLTRAVNEYEKIIPKVYVEYNTGMGADTIPAFSDETIGSSVDEEIKIAGGVMEKNPWKADLVLLVNTDPKGITKDGIYGEESYRVRPGTIEFADLVGNMLWMDYKVAVADIAFANGSDNALMNVMNKRNYLTKLCAYAGWNTPTNSSGFVIGQGILASRLQEKDRQRLLMERYLDDWCYQSNVRYDLMELIPREYGDFNICLYMGKHEDELAVKTQGLLRKFAVDNLPQYDGLNEVTVSFPWHRTFIGGIELPKY